MRPASRLRQRGISGRLAVGRRSGAPGLRSAMPRSASRPGFAAGRRRSRRAMRNAAEPRFHQRQVFGHRIPVLPGRKVPRDEPGELLVLLHEHAVRLDDALARDCAIRVPEHAERQQRRLDLRASSAGDRAGISRRPMPCAPARAACRSAAIIDARFVASPAFQAASRRCSSAAASLASPAIPSSSRYSGCRAASSGSASQRRTARASRRGFRRAAARRTARRQASP